MNYYDVNGEVGQGPTTTGWSDFTAWAAEQHLTHTCKFFEHGETSDMTAIAKELSPLTAAKPDVEEVRASLLDAAKKAKRVLILSH